MSTAKAPAAPSDRICEKSMKGKFSLFKILRFPSVLHCDALRNNIKTDPRCVLLDASQSDRGCGSLVEWVISQNN